MGARAHLRPHPRRPPHPHGVYVTWLGPQDHQGEDAPVLADTPVVSAFDYDGTRRWTLSAGQLPFFGREGARLGGLPYCTVTEDVVSLYCGPWFVVVEDPRMPSLGPLQHTQPPERR